jgi:hypothetical protein
MEPENWCFGSGYNCVHSLCIQPSEELHGNPSNLVMNRIWSTYGATTSNHTYTFKLVLHY